MHGHWKLVLGIIGLAGGWSAWRHHSIDYHRYPPAVVITGAARDTLNAAYETYRDSDSAVPYVEHGFCARTWTTQRTGWNTTTVRITSVVRSEVNASPISVFVPCGQSPVDSASSSHPPAAAVRGARHRRRFECAPMQNHQGERKPSY